MAQQNRSTQGKAGSDTTASASRPADKTSNGHSPSASPFSLPIPGVPGGVTPKRVLWWGGLTAVAAAGIIEWPVAAAVGVGTWVAERLAREDARHDAAQRS